MPPAPKSHSTRRSWLGPSGLRLVVAVAGLVLVLQVSLATPAGADGGYRYDDGPAVEWAGTTAPSTAGLTVDEAGVSVGAAAVAGGGVQLRRAAGRVAPRTAPRVTEPMIRNAMTDVPLQSQQGAVSLPKVQSAVDQLAAGSPAPPIRVDGSIIVDGNHRYIAGQIMDDVPAIQPWPGGNSSRVVPWWKQVIDPTDWGG